GAGADVRAETRQLLEERLLIVTDGGSHVAPRKFDQAGPRDVFVQVAARVDTDSRKPRTVQHERRYPDRVEHAADVDVEVHAQVVAHRPRADAEAKDASESASLVLAHVRIAAGHHLPLPARLP